MTELAILPLNKWTCHQDKATARADAENPCEKPCHVYIYRVMVVSLLFMQLDNLGYDTIRLGSLQPQTELVHTHYDVPFPPGL